MIHDRLQPARGTTLDRQTSARIAGAFGPSAARGHQLEHALRPSLLLRDYRDPLEDADAPWLMALRAVGGTGFVVGVQTRHDRVAAPFAVLLQGLSRVGIFIGMSVLAVLGVAARVGRAARRL